MKNTLYILLFILAIVLVRNWENRDITHPPGVLVAETPRQNPLAQSNLITLGDYSITPRAAFNIRARVLSREDYSWSDGSDLSPVDLALGWGAMSDSGVLEDIKISQSGRFYYWNLSSWPIPRKEIETHSANMHLIPKNRKVAAKIKRAREGDVVQLRGSLVYVEAEDGWRWKSSLTRNDTGAGACEVIWVEDFKVLKR